MSEPYDPIARFFDSEYSDYADDLPIIQAYAQRTGGRLLELGCGAGRLLIPLAKAGYQVTGVDSSPAMLRITREKAAAAGVSDRITLIEGDYSAAPLPGAYGLAFIVMNSFMHLLTQAAQLRALRHWRQHLAADGLLLLDVQNPDIAELAGLNGSLEVANSWVEPETGATCLKLLSRTVEPAEQIMHVTVIYEALAGESQLRRAATTFDLRYLWGPEARLLLERAGFVREAVYGGWNMQPLTSASERMILVARPKT